MWKLGNPSLNNEGVKEEMTQKIRMLFFSRSVVSESLRLHELQPVSHHLPGFVQEAYSLSSEVLGGGYLLLELILLS